MSSTASINIEEIGYENRSFYRSTYMDVSVVRTKDGYYNATKICQDNGIRDIYDIMRFKWWKTFETAIKSSCKIDRNTNKIIPYFDSAEESSTVNYRSNFSSSKNDINIEDKEDLLNGETSEINVDDSEEESSSVKTHSNFFSNESNQITNEDLYFEVKLRGNDTKWIAGTYIHEIMLNKLLMHVNDNYAIKISYLINMINEELRLRNITLEQKIVEKEEELKKLQELHANSNKSKVHDYPGCLILKHKHNNVYKMSSWVVATRSDNIKNNETVIYNIYNPDDAYREFDFYAKQGQLKNIKRVSHGVYEIESLDNIYDAIEKIQNFLIEPPSIETILTNLKKSYKPNHFGFQGRMFEVFCSEKFKIPLFPHAPGEKLGLQKQDIGLDLLDMNNKIMGQCKYYITSTLSVNNMPRFIDFVETYHEYTHRLYVSSLTKLSPKILEMKNIEVVIVDDDEFQSWYLDQIADVVEDINSKYNTPAHQWLKNELESKPFLYVNDVISELNGKFKMNITCQHQFAELFCPIYRRLAGSKSYARDTVNDKAFISNPKHPIPIISDGKVVNDPTTSTRLIYLTQDERQEERQFLIETIKYGQYTLDDLLPLFQERFGRPTTNKSLSIHTDIFITLKRSDVTSYRYPKKKLGDKRVQIYELKDDILPEKWAVIKDFIATIQDQKLEKQIELVNKEFHRYEMIQTYHKISKK